MVKPQVPEAFFEMKSDEPLLHAHYFFHDTGITFQTNHPLMLTILDSMLSIFPAPAIQRSTITYTVLCYEREESFPLPLPAERKRTDTIRLLTNTRMKYYRDLNSHTEYHSYQALPPVNEVALSVIRPDQKAAVTQLLLPEHYQPTFLRRYVFLLTLGQLMYACGFEPCHAAAVTAPDNAQTGALILGNSGSGKTTLSLGCALTGCGLLGDDLMMLHRQEDTLIKALAISHEVSIRSGSFNLWPELKHLCQLPVDHRDKRYCHINDIRNGAAQDETTVRLLLFPSLLSETKSRITPLTKAQTLQQLFARCFSNTQVSSQAQERLFLLLSELTEQAAGYQLYIARHTNDGPEMVRSLFAGIS